MNESGSKQLRDAFSNWSNNLIRYVITKSIQQEYAYTTQRDIFQILIISLLVFHFAQPHQTSRTGTMNAEDSSQAYGGTMSSLPCRIAQIQVENFEETFKWPHRAASDDAPNAAKGETAGALCSITTRLASCG